VLRSLQIQNLTGIVEYLRNTTIKSVDEFVNTLKLDLSLLDKHIGWRVPPVAEPAPLTPDGLAMFI